LVEFVRIQIRERIDELEVLQSIFELLYATVTKEMQTLKEYLGHELYQIYFRLA